MEGRRVPITTRATRRCVSWALYLALCIFGISLAEPPQRYAVNLHAEGVADALNELSEQTGVPVVFSYDLAKSRKANPVVGDFTLQEALDALLKGSGLVGGLSDKGVLLISPAPAGAPETGETIVTEQNKRNPSTTKTRGAGVAGFVASLAAAFSASAQVANNESGDEAQTKMDDVVITAQKRSERLQDVPVPVSVVNTDALAETNQTALRDYFNQIPGFNVTPNYVNTQNLSIRGVTTGGLSTTTVGVVIDDIPFGASGSHGVIVPDLDPGQLDHIEVLRGPQGTLYGANSMGGLVKFMTVDPTSAGLTGRVEVGSDYVAHSAERGYNLRGSVNIPISDTLAIGASGFTRQDPGYIDNPVYRLEDVNRSQSEGARLSAMWRPTDTVSLKLSALYQDSTADALNEAENLPGLSGLEQSYLPGSGHSLATMQVYSAILKVKVGNIELASLTGYSVNHLLTDLDDTPNWGSTPAQAFGLPVALTGVPLFNSDTVAKVSQELRATIDIGPSVEWMLGAFYTHEHDVAWFNDAVENLSTGQLVGNYWYYNQNLDSFAEMAGFTDLTWHVTDLFSVQLGGRESHYKINLAAPVQEGPYVGGGPLVSPAEESSANAFTYLVTPEMKLSHDLMVYARFASGYRPGTPNLPAFDVPRESAPDKTKSYEIGVKSSMLDNRLSADLSIYYIDWTNIQIQLTDPVTEFVYNTNGSRAKSQGVEFALSAKPVKGLTISAWVDYDDAVLTQAFPPNSSSYGVPGDRLPLSSRYSGNLSLSQTFPLSGSVVGFVGGQASYVGNRIGIFGQSTAPQRQYFPAYTKGDLNAGVMYGPWKVTGFVNNVADSRALISGGIGYYPPFAEIFLTPRTIGLNATRVF